MSISESPKEVEELVIPRYLRGIPVEGRSSVAESPEEYSSILVVETNLK